MSYDTLMNTSRGGVATNTPYLPMRIQEMRPRERMEFTSGAGELAAYDFFWLHTLDGGSLTIERGDLCTDMQHTDALTGQAALYRVAGRPTDFDQCYYKIPAYRYITSRTDGS